MPERGHKAALVIGIDGRNRRDGREGADLHRPLRGEIEDRAVLWRNRHKQSLGSPHKFWG